MGSAFYFDGSSLLSLGIMWVLLMATAVAQAQQIQLVPGFYQSSCPQAETLIASAVNAALNRRASAAAGVLRMFFHDCFVHGCDASVLIDAPGSERFAPANRGLQGFDVIDAAKAAVEQQCPGVVSCADILALAAQLSVQKLSGGRISYQVGLGRRDGVVSSATDVTGKLPRFDASVATLKATFSANGLSAEDMVVLSGAHSVGTAGCAFIQSRLVAATDLDATYAAVLHKQCSQPGGSVNLDLATPTQLDEKYYTNLQANRGLFTSDQNLQLDPETRPMVAANADFRTFGPNFARAMQKMGAVVHLSPAQGEIRRACSAFN